MEEYDKKYYKIKDVAEIISVPQSTLRFWEREFPELNPVRSASNIRYYKPADIELVKLIHYLLKTKGLKLDAAKEQLRNNRSNISRRVEVIDRLLHVRSELMSLQKAMRLRKIPE